MRNIVHDYAVTDRGEYIKDTIVRFQSGDRRSGTARFSKQPSPMYSSESESDYDDYYAQNYEGIQYQNVFNILNTTIMMTSKL
jgi:hypothetical protein